TMPPPSTMPKIMEISRRMMSQSSSDSEGLSDTSNEYDNGCPFQPVSSCAGTGEAGDNPRKRILWQDVFFLVPIPEDEPKPLL
ncbi:MAG: hypothetical protein ACKVT0_05845, partial [Planctomycetaceae bacterium]